MLNIKSALNSPNYFQQMAASSRRTDAVFRSQYSWLRITHGRTIHSGSGTPDSKETNLLTYTQISVSGSVRSWESRLPIKCQCPHKTPFSKRGIHYQHSDASFKF